ncbi:hypothetical protein [Methanosarcina horonobensis]|uniref:hypothetical protein n=1 Tax=Methanosarcina horonobensis TaxID=418008 RepID=UPI000B02B5DB|nr:hypothetical protein [Methanosarcina horonobensis]
MTENATELPRIDYQRTITTLDKHEYINIDVKGQTLEECRKHFDEILRGVKDE